MMEVDIPTGFRIDKQNLRDNERWGPYHIWKRSRFTRQKVYLHIDYVSVAVYKLNCETFVSSWNASGGISEAH